MALTRRASKPEPWMLVYPTIDTVAQASKETCASWAAHLPKPQTDVERTVRRRISARVDDWLRQEAPDFAQRLDDIYARFHKATGIDLKDAVNRGDFS